MSRKIRNLILTGVFVVPPALLALLIQRGVVSSSRDDLLESGFEHEFEGELEEAFACYKKAVDIDPEHYCSHFMLGRVAQNLGKMEEAGSSFRRAYELVVQAGGREAGLSDSHGVLFADIRGAYEALLPGSR